MDKNNNRKQIARDQTQVAVENFLQAELEGAETIAPVTYRWAKTKIYENRKIILDLHSTESAIVNAAEEASAAAAQLLSATRRNKIKDEVDQNISPLLYEKEAIENFQNEGGPSA